MRKLLIAPVVFLFIGCAPINEELVDTVSTAWSLIEPAYTEYVQEDPDLTPESKETRLRHAQALTELLQEARNDG